MNTTIGWIGWALAVTASLLGVCGWWSARHLARLYCEAREGWNRGVALAVEANTQALAARTNAIRMQSLAEALTQHVNPLIAEPLWRAAVNPDEQPRRRDA